MPVSNQSYIYMKTRIFSDIDIYNHCSAVCGEIYVACIVACESSSCQSNCLRDYAHCEDNCPCGRNCPPGCENCDSPYCKVNSCFEHDCGPDSICFAFGNEPQCFNTQIIGFLMHDRNVSFSILKTTLRFFR